LQLFLHYPANEYFQWLLLGAHLRTEGLIDERLVAATPGGLDALSKPVEHVVVEANGDACLARLDGTTAPRRP
jgi:hypothetical protein